MVTLEDFKNKEAREQNAKDWDDFLTQKIDIYFKMDVLELAAKRYSEYYATKMCVEQIRICAERACFKVETMQGVLISDKQIASIDDKSNNHYYINKKHIYNSPLATKK